jgi:hypothetical protein
VVVAELASPNETVGTDPGVVAPSPTRMRANIKPRPIIGRVAGGTALTAKSAASEGAAAMSATKAPHAYKTFFISSLPLDFLRIKMLRLLRTEFCDTSATIREKYSLIVLVVAVWRGWS